MRPLLAGMVALLCASSAARAETQAEFEQRKAAAVKAAMDQAQSIRREDQNRQAARKEAVEAQERAHREAIEAAAAEQAERFAQTKWTLPLFSAILCGAQHDRAATTAEIAKEKRLTAEVGVMDKKVMGDFLEALRSADERARYARTQLLQRKVKPLPCGNRLVKRIEVCLADDGTCDEESSQYRALAMGAGTP